MNQTQSPAVSEPSEPASGNFPLSRWLPLPWPPNFFVPGCFCCGGGACAYSCGGMDLYSTTFFATTDRTQFSTDLSSAIPAADLSTPRGEVSAVANPGVAGYVAGGHTGAGGATAVTKADKLSFSTEITAAATTANLSLARYALGSLSERTTKAYFAGGFTTAIVSLAEKLTFSTDATAAQTSAGLSASRGGVAGLSDGSTKGYFGGGFTGSLRWTAQTDKIVFATDVTSSQTSANLTTVRDRYQALSDGSTKGYFCGGQTGIGFAICDKVTFATDVTTTQTSAAIDRYAGAAMSNGVIGYATGGVTPAGLSTTIQRFTFSNDTVAALGVGSNLSAGRVGIGGLSTVAL